MRFDRVGWIAEDLARDLRARPGLLALLPFAAVVYPFLMGIADGGIMCAAPAGSWSSGLRLSVIGTLLGPASTILVVGADLLFARKLNRELEPLLSAPVTNAEIAAGFVAPPLLATLLLAPFGFAACETGYAVMSCAGPPGLPGDFPTFLLATLVSAAWLSAATLHAVFRAAGTTELGVRLVPAWLGLALLDGIRLLLARSGLPGADLALLAAALAAGLVALALAAARLDREDLILRVRRPARR